MRADYYVLMLWCYYILLLSLNSYCLGDIYWAWPEFREIFREIWGGFQENEINEINAKFGGVPREIFIALLSDKKKRNKTHFYMFLLFFCCIFAVFAKIQVFLFLICSCNNIKH